MRCENCGSPKIYTDDEHCIEDIGRLADSIDNMLAGMNISGMPVHITIVALKEALSEWRERARAAYVRLAGENPWADK